MRIQKEINIGLIDTDSYRFHKKTLDYANLMLAGVIFPPISLYKKEHGRFQIKDGRHRYLAAKLCQKKTILAKFSEKLFHETNKENQTR